MVIVIVVIIIIIIIIIIIDLKPRTASISLFSLSLSLSLSLHSCHSIASSLLSAWNEMSGLKYFHSNAENISAVLIPFGKIESE